MTSTASIFTEEGKALDPEMMAHIMASLGPDTAYPDPDVRAMAMTEKAAGSCVVASVIYAGLAVLEGKPCRFKRIIVRDTEQAGTPLEEHFMLTDGLSLVDFTKAKHGEGEFEFYSEAEMDRKLEWLLSEPTLAQRIQKALDKMGKAYTAAQIFEAFHQSYQEGRSLNIAQQALKHQLSPDRYDH